jgi:hypothetical protein
LPQAGHPSSCALRCRLCRMAYGRVTRDTPFVVCGACVDAWCVMPRESRMTRAAHQMRERSNTTISHPGALRVRARLPGEAARNVNSRIERVMLTPQTHH